MEPGKLKQLFSIIFSDYKFNGFGFSMPDEFYINFTQTYYTIDQIPDIFNPEIIKRKKENNINIKGGIVNKTMVFKVFWNGSILTGPVELPFKESFTDDFPKFFIDTVKRYFEIE